MTQPTEPIATIDLPRALSLLESAAEAHPDKSPDCVYVRDAVTRLTFGEMTDPRPECVVGHVLVYGLGIDPSVLVDEWPVPFDYLVNLEGVYQGFAFTPDAVAALTFAQALQDDRPEQAGDTLRRSGRQVPTYLDGPHISRYTWREVVEATREAFAN